MNQKFDPYYKWLGIPPKDQPPNHYRLLGIELFEVDREVIDAASNRLMAYLHDLASGDEEGHSQRLLNEISNARTTLLNKSDKQKYDKQLRGKIKTAVVVVPPAQPPPAQQPPLRQVERLPPAPPRVMCPQCNGPKHSEIQVCPNCSHDPHTLSVKDSSVKDSPTTGDFTGIMTGERKRPKSDRDSQVFDSLAALQAEPIQKSPSGGASNIPVGDLELNTNKPKKTARPTLPSSDEQRASAEQQPANKKQPSRAKRPQHVQKPPQVVVKRPAENVTALVVPSIAEPPIVESPIAESPIAESPIAESPIAESPIAESPIAEPLIAEPPRTVRPARPIPVAVPHASASAVAVTTGIVEGGITELVAGELSDAISAGTTPKSSPLIWIGGGVVLVAIVLTIIVVVASNSVTPPPPQRPATVLVISWPITDRQGAELIVDGDAVEIPQESPFEVLIEPGQRHLELKRTGFETINAFLTAATGKKNRFLPHWLAVDAEPRVPNSLTPHPPIALNPNPSSVPAINAPNVDEPPTFTMGTLRELGESSGLTRSGLPDHYWTHNDSGGDPALYLIHQGAIVSILRLPGRNLDWEDVASAEIAGKRYLYIADTGDNTQRRDAVQQIYKIYVVAEPELSLPDVPRRFFVRPDRVVQFQYADGKHDCEAMAVRRDGSIVLVTKNRSGGPAYVYSLTSPFGHPETEYQETTTRKATLNIPMVTGLDISPQFDRIAILTTENILEYNLDRDLATTSKIPGRQTALPRGVKKGEAISYNPSGRRWILTSEGFNQPVWSVPIR